ncbi:MAG: mobile mystery protein B [Calditrichaeota bacterium]|nr:mobile mystery protein B [Calditrichota bacterium]
MTIFEDPEGSTPLDPDAIEGLRFPHVTTRGELDHLEAGNIVDGLRWLERQSGEGLLTEQFAKTLHRNLFGQVWSWAGSFRARETSIGVEPIQISVELRKLLDDTQYWIEYKTFDDVETALRFHHRLVYIHLFPNGNGRHARIMADALSTKLLKTKAIDWSRGLDLQAANLRRQKYIAALRAADRGDYTLLLDFARTQ